MLGAKYNKGFDYGVLRISWVPILLSKYVSPDI